MPDDDRPIGRLIRRRDMLAMLGGAAVSLWSPGWARAQSVSCVATPEQTDGPFFVDERLERSDVRSDPATGASSDGASLTLALTVLGMTGRNCSPLPGAIVDIWHCDAAGVYSDVGGEGSQGRKFLRGYQKTDDGGRVKFVTIYPGWYPGRAVHIHFKIRSASSGKRVAFSSQLYFDDALTDRVFTRKPYAERGRRSTRNANDFLYRGGGTQLMLTPAEGPDGYSARFDVGLQV